jgi:hypothetical protein
MKKVANCVYETDDPFIVFSERGRSASFSNPQREKFVRLHIDGCLITTGCRCDFALTKPGTGTVFVELKGKDIRHGCDQLFKSVEHENLASRIERRRSLLIVCSRFPAVDTRIQNEKLNARKKGWNLTIKCGKFEGSFAALL